MLGGETQKTLCIGLIVSVLVFRTPPDSIHVCLDSGLEGIIKQEYLVDDTPGAEKPVKGKMTQGVIIDVRIDHENNIYEVELSSHWSDHEKDLDILAWKQRAEVTKTRRIIKHPNFHNFNTSQAEQYLDGQQRGDVVIQPSSKGIDHLAVTWKVDDKLYQHIDITEKGYGPTGQSLDTQFVVDASHTYIDLDELIVRHVNAMS
ncbi:SH2 domain-containing protein [Lentinula edodes]|uniref:SH2 domain-containing protein n=1 Tax=Lentinula edodes TaxID=5353 RepID=UPI001E8D0A08|nr:SH2 domain-containing protein [Lentinula edodes]KAH7878553.1 SH2 domain-containing protein [Lentinula edodes]